MSWVKVIRAVPTRYSGIRFRSRLEARWAFFFDELDIEWEYEPHWYELLDSFTKEVTRYKPDFLLPGLRCWVEVKRPWETIDDVERARIVEKCDLLARRTEHAVVLCHDYPGGGPHWATVGGCPTKRECWGCDASWEACDSFSDRMAFFSSVEGLSLVERVEGAIDPRSESEIQAIAEAGQRALDAYLEDA